MTLRSVHRPDVLLATTPVLGAAVALVTDERALVEGIRAGEAGAFEVLFHRYYSPLVDFASGYLPAGNAMDAAEDVVHEVLLRVWRDRATWALRGTLRAYLFGAVRNRALNMTRHARVAERWRPLFTSDYGVPGLAEGGVGPDAAMERASDDAVRDARIQAAVAALPARQREVLLLRVERGLSNAEAAEVMGIAARSAETFHWRAVQALRRSLEGMVR
jgi:RNA polymerase sigma-70 factor (ECF subfamily)